MTLLEGVGPNSLFLHFSVIDGQNTNKEAGHLKLSTIVCCHNVKSKSFKLESLKSSSKMDVTTKIK